MFTVVAQLQGLFIVHFVVHEFTVHLCFTVVWVHGFFVIHGFFVQSNLNVTTGSEQILFCFEAGVVHIKQGGVTGTHNVV